MDKPVALVTSSESAKNMSTKLFGEAAKKQKKTVTKILLEGLDQLQPKWPAVPDESAERIRSILIRFFTEGQCRCLDTKEKRMIGKKDPTPEDIVTQQHLVDRQLAMQNMKKNVAMGINEVTKWLERKTLRLVVADRSVRPFSFISHLPQLAASNGIPAVALDNLAHSLASILGIKSVVAIGFRDVPETSSVVNSVQPLVPPIVLPRIMKSTEAVDVFHKEAISKVQSDTRILVESGHTKKELITSTSDSGISYLPVIVRNVAKNEQRTKRSSRKKKKEKSKLAEPSAKRRRLDIE